MRPFVDGGAGPGQRAVACHNSNKPPLSDVKLDRNPLIDVALVLLVFFILTTSYGATQKVLEMPAMSRVPDPGHGIPRIDPHDPAMIRVALSRSGDETVYQVDGRQVRVEDLKAAIQQYVSPGRTDVLIDAASEVPWGAVVTVQDRARAAGRSTPTCWRDKWAVSGQPFHCGWGSRVCAQRNAIHEPPERTRLAPRVRCASFGRQSYSPLTHAEFLSFFCHTSRDRRNGR
jgi:biopolymer transport protein ExbD